MQKFQAKNSICNIEGYIAATFFVVPVTGFLSWKSSLHFVTYLKKFRWPFVQNRKPLQNLMMKGKQLTFLSRCILPCWFHHQIFSGVWRCSARWCLFYSRFY